MTGRLIAFEGGEGSGKSTQAARLADRLGAPELVLLKSAPLPTGANRAEAARLGLVDPAFPAASRNLPFVAYLNLRDPSATARPL